MKSIGSHAGVDSSPVLTHASATVPPERHREAMSARMSARSSARAAKAKPIIAGSDEEADHKNRIDKLQKEENWVDPTYRFVDVTKGARHSLSITAPLAYPTRSRLPPPFVIVCIHKALGMSKTAALVVSHSAGEQARERCCLTHQASALLSSSSPDPERGVKRRWLAGPVIGLLLVRLVRARHGKQGLQGGGTYLVDLVDVGANVIVGDDVLEVHQELVALRQRLAQRVPAVVTLSSIANPGCA